MSKNILSFVKLLFASLFDKIHGLGMSALAGVVLPKVDCFLTLFDVMKYWRHNAGAS
jgi:hypothetical protein